MKESECALRSPLAGTGKRQVCSGSCQRQGACAHAGTNQNGSAEWGTGYGD